MSSVDKRKQEQTKRKIIGTKKSMSCIYDLRNKWKRTVQDKIATTKNVEFGKTNEYSLGSQCFVV